MQGRCAGCGEVGPEAAIVSHTAGCRAFARLYRENPERASLSAAAEYRRWKDEDKDSETRDRIAVKVAATDAQRAVMADRFRTPDILED
jgi:hypothetical protein